MNPLGHGSGEDPEMAQDARSFVLTACPYEAGEQLPVQYRAL